MKYATLIAALAITAAAEYRSEPAGAPPAELSAHVDAKGFRIVNPRGQVWAEFWFANKPPAKAAAAETNASVPGAHGAFIGVVRTEKGMQDRRGDAIKPGVYVLRLSFHPMDGAHQGIATQRDFLILTPAEGFAPAATPDFAALMDLAKKASGTNHPWSLSCWKDEVGQSGLKPEAEEKDWVLHVTVGDVPLAIIVAGKAEG